MARGRQAIAVALSILVNALLIIAIIFTLPPPPAQLPKPIAVKIVPPSVLAQASRQPPVARPKPPLPPPPPPRARSSRPDRLASQDIGDPNAPKTAIMGSEAAAAGPAMTEEGSTQPPAKADSPRVRTAKPDLTPERKPAPRHGGAKVRAILAPPHASRHYAKIPGPDATADQYFAYLNSAFDACLTPRILADLHTAGRVPKLAFTLKRNGVILLPFISHSSGSALVDQEFLELPDCVGRLAPLPDYVPDPSIAVEYGNLGGSP